MTAYKSELLEVSLKAVLNEQEHNLMVLDQINSKIKKIKSVHYGNAAHSNLLDQKMYVESNLRDIQEILNNK